MVRTIQDALHPAHATTLVEGADQTGKRPRHRVPRRPEPPRRGIGNLASQMVQATLQAYFADEMDSGLLARVNGPLNLS